MVTILYFLQYWFQ